MTVQLDRLTGDEHRPDETAPAAPAQAPARVPWNKRRSWVRLRRLLFVAMFGACIWFLARRGSELQGAWGLFRRVDWRWVAAALLFEAASMVVFARVQWWLLRAGRVTLPLRTMVEITVAGNAIAATLPGGVALAAAWAFGQLARRGVSRFLRVWVFLVAGAVSSFALFVVVAVGIEVSGDRGPVADLRWAVVGLAAVPVFGLAVVLARRWRRVRAAEVGVAGALQRVPGGGWLVGSGRSLVRQLRAVHLTPLRWAEVLALAVLNWLYDCAVLVCSLLALHVAVPWRGVFVIYGITQVAAALPITPGGLVVVEGSMAALLSAYGVHPQAVVATVVLYRVVSFWGLVPVGWGVWVALDLRQRRGRTSRVHPWAFHGPPLHPADEGALLRRPLPCRGCEEEAEDPTCRTGSAA